MITRFSFKIQKNMRKIFLLLLGNNKRKKRKKSTDCSFFHTRSRYYDDDLRQYGFNGLENYEEGGWITNKQEIEMKMRKTGAEKYQNIQFLVFYLFSINKIINLKSWLKYWWFCDILCFILNFSFILKVLQNLMT